MKPKCTTSKVRYSLIIDINPAAIVLRHLLPELEFTSFCSLADTNLIFGASYHLVRDKLLTFWGVIIFNIKKSHPSSETVHLVAAMLQVRGVAITWRPAALLARLQRFVTWSCFSENLCDFSR